MTISKSDFFSLLDMLKGIDEDFNIAIENIKNLHLDTIFIMFFIKALDTKKRHKFKSLMDVSFNVQDLDFLNLYLLAKESEDENAKLIFDYFIRDFFTKVNYHEKISIVW